MYIHRAYTLFYTLEAHPPRKPIYEGEQHKQPPTPYEASSLRFYIPVYEYVCVYKLKTWFQLFAPPALPCYRAATGSVCRLVSPGFPLISFWNLAYRSRRRHDWHTPRWRMFQMVGLWETTCIVAGYNLPGRYLGPIVRTGEGKNCHFWVFQVWSSYRVTYRQSDKYPHYM